MAAATRTTGVGASAWRRRLVSLDPLHEQIARIAFALPEAGQVALPGCGAMLAHDLVDRPTQDVDLFTPDPAEVRRLTDALALALRTEGAQVQVDRRGPGFTRLAVTVADGRSVVVEIAHDARIRESVQLSFGRVLHPDEVAVLASPFPVVASGHQLVHDLLTG